MPRRAPEAQAGARDRPGRPEVAGPDSAAARIDEAAVLAAFEHLSVDDRHILVLHHLHDLPLAQIAVQLRIPVGTAKSRLWSARRALERALEAER